jgi:hypothetical protein
MSKKKVTAAETLHMNIELADNGIIIRNPDCEDEVTLAIENNGSCDNHGNEYRAIGWKLYDWLMNVVLQDQDPNEIITTGFQLEIIAKCEGRSM